MAKADEKDERVTLEHKKTGTKRQFEPGMRDSALAAGYREPATEAKAKAPANKGRAPANKGGSARTPATSSSNPGEQTSTAKAASGSGTP